MDMFFPPFLAQQDPAAPAGPAGPVPGVGPTVFDRFHAWFHARYDADLTVSLLVFLGILLVTTISVERVSMAIVRRLTSRTDTKVDDVFVEGIPGIVRTICVLLALQVATETFLTGDTQALATRALRAISVAAIGILATRLVLRIVDAWVEQRPAMQPLRPGIKLTIKVLVIPLILITLLQSLGVEIHAFLTALGVGALAVGLALQDVLKNIFAGVQLVLDQPVRAGDFVQIDKDVRGTVLEMGLRSTKLKTLEGNVVVVPNATLAGAIITNADLGDRSFSHTVTIGVAYGSDTRRVEGALLEEAKAVATTVEGFVPDEVVVNFAALGDSALVFKVTVRMKQFAGHGPALSELHHRLYARLTQEKVEIPFPTQTVILRREATPA